MSITKAIHVCSLSFSKPVERDGPAFTSGRREVRFRLVDGLMIFNA